jgi:hypothetical protein
MELIAAQLGVPRSTIHGWKKARSKPVVTLVAPNSYVDDLEKRVVTLERRTARLRALLRLCIVWLRLSGFYRASQRIPDGDDKYRLLRSIDPASRFVRLMARDAVATDQVANNPLAPRESHFPAKAKRVIFIFCGGGPSPVNCVVLNGRNQPGRYPLKRINGSWLFW